MSKNVNFSGFSAQQISFMLALADPEDQRPQYEIAAQLGVTQETLSRWKRLPSFTETLWQITHSNLESEIGRVSSALLNRALQGDLKAVRIYFELLGKIGSRRSEAPCTREHILSSDEFAEGLKNQLTEKQLNLLADEVASQFPEFYPPKIRYADDDVNVRDRACVELV